MRYFKGYLKDYLDERKEEMERYISFGWVQAPELNQEFLIVMPEIDFRDPLDIVRLDSETGASYVFKFTIIGNSEILKYQPSISVVSLPDWTVVRNEFWIKIDEADLDRMKVKIDGIIANLQDHLSDLRDDLRIYNDKLPSEIQRITRKYEVDEKNTTIVDLQNYLINHD